MQEAQHNQLDQLESLLASAAVKVGEDEFDPLVVQLVKRPVRLAEHLEMVIPLLDVAPASSLAEILQVIRDDLFQLSLLNSKLLRSGLKICG